MNKKKRLAILTSGGDAPGMNAAVYGFGVEAKMRGYEAFVVYEGLQGLIDDQIFPLDLTTAKSKAKSAGSFIGSTRSLSFKNDINKRKLALDNLRKHEIDCLFVGGGDGSYKGAECLMELGFPVITIPCTIDNDVSSSIYTIGFFSAMQEIVNAIETVRATSSTNNQVILIEVMGRNCCDLAVYAGLAGKVDAVVTYENIFSMADFVNAVDAAKIRNQKEVIFLVSELIYGPRGNKNLPSLEEVAEYIEKNTGYRSRAMSLSYLQRGAKPTAFEIHQAIGFGSVAVKLFSEGRYNIAVGFNGYAYYVTDLEKANSMTRVSRKVNIDWINSINKIV